MMIHGESLRRNPNVINWNSTYHKWAPHLPEKQPLQKNKNTDNTINISTRIAKFPNCPI